MKITIEQVANGYLVTEDLSQTEQYVFTEFIDLLRYINDLEGEGSRHSEKRIYIIEAPGDKHEKFTDTHSEVIWGDND